MGVSHKKYDNSQKMVSNASCTTNSLALPAMVFHDNFGFMERLRTTVDAIAATQKNVAGSSGKLWRDGHRAAQDIISAPIGASKAVDKVIPEPNEKFTGMDVHVPTWNEPFMNLTCHLEKAVKFDDIKMMVKQESENPLKGILGYTEDQLSSVTVIATPTPPPLVLGLELFSSTTLKSSFSSSD